MTREEYINILEIDKAELTKENQELKLELSGYRKAILNNKEMLGLKEENQELKKQLENNLKINISDHKYASECEDKVIVLENQQKEFIKYLEDEIEECFSSGDCRELKTFQNILQKNKSIIGED